MPEPSSVVNNEDMASGKLFYGDELLVPRERITPEPGLFA